MPAPLPRVPRVLGRLAFAGLLLMLPLPAFARRVKPLTLHVPAFIVPPNSDREVCTFVGVPADQPYDIIQVAIANHRVPRGVRFTSHHFLLYAYTGSDVGGFPAKGVVQDSHACIDFGPTDTNQRILIDGSQSPMSVEREPAGLAQQAVPLKDAKGRLVLPFILNSHWINGSSQPHEASVVVKLVPAKPHTVRRLTKPIFAVTANAALDVPPGTVRSTESSTAAADAVVGRLGFKLVDAWGPGMADFGAAFGGAPIPQGPACVTYLFGHMHKRGEVFGIDFIASDGTVQNGPPSSQLENPDEPGRYHLYLGTRPIVEAMHLEALQQPYLCTDATGVLVQAPEQCRQGHFWVLIAPALHVLFRYSARHDKEAVDGLLPGYQGVLVADAHSVYDHLFADGVVTEAGCWSHLRRYWFKTLGSEPEKGREALAMIGALFAIERSLVDAPPARRLVVRHEMSRPLVKQFFDWCLALKDTALDETPLAKALGYATNHQKAFERFLDDGRLPMHNNWSELQLRRQVIGRRNWIFTGSDDGAEVNTVFVSLLASCGLHQLEPWTYLRDLFCLLPSWPRSRVLALAPAYWKRTFEDEETQQKLADNPFRSAVLALDRVHPDDP